MEVGVGVEFEEEADVPASPRSRTSTSTMDYETFFVTRRDALLLELNGREKLTDVDIDATIADEWRDNPFDWVR